MKKEQKKRTEIGCGADDLRVGTGRDADGTENGDINKDRELDMRIGMYAALDVLEPEDVEAFLSRIPEETWSEDRLENMVSDLEDNHACDGEEDRISVQKIRDRVQQQVSENLKENAENQAGEGITRQNFETVNRKKVKSNHFSWRRLAGAAAVAALALLVWQKDTVYAGLGRMLRLVPGVAVYEENEAAWYTVVPVNARFSWQGWIYELQEGYVERMPDQAGLTNRGRLVIRLTAQKDSVSAAESEQQASTGDPANMRENTQENTQQEVGLADASYFGDNRLYRRKKDSQDTWELLTDGGSGFGTEQTEDDEAGPKKIVIGKENLKKWKSILAAFLIPVVLILGYQKVLLPACGVEDNGPKEALSIPFQQTARYVRDYGAEVTAEEAEIIGKVLDYENLAELYDPITSDPVKYTYHAETTGELLDYFRVWAIQLVKHPANAVEATMNNVYGWFYQEGYTQNYMMTSRIDGQDVRWEISQPAKLAGVRQVMERVAKLLSRVPVLNWFENAGMVSMLLILLVAVWIGAGKKRYLVAVSPLIVAVLVCIAGPTFNYQMRYIMPVMFSVPFLAGLFVQSMREL